MNLLNERARALRSSIQHIDYVLEKYPLSYVEASLWLTRRATLNDEFKAVLEKLNSDS